MKYKFILFSPWLLNSPGLAFCCFGAVDAAGGFGVLGVLVGSKGVFREL